MVAPIVRKISVSCTYSCAGMRAHCVQKTKLVILSRKVVPVEPRAARTLNKGTALSSDAQGSHVPARSPTVSPTRFGDARVSSRSTRTL